MSRSPRPKPERAETQGLDSDLNDLSFRFWIAGSVTCGRGWKLDVFQQMHHRLVVVRGGSGHLVLGDRKVPLRRGHLVFGLPGELYGIEQHPHKRLVISIVRFDVFNPAKKQVTLPPQFRSALCSEVKCFPLLEELMLRLTNAVPKVPCWAGGLSASLFRSVLWLIREDHHSSDDLQAFNIASEALRPLQSVNLVPGGREPSTRELAKLCGMSSSTFARRMRIRFGMSPKKVLIQRRMERAKMLLLESPYTIEAIATELGYKEPGHFTRQFKKWVGVSPSAFRTPDR